MKRTHIELAAQEIEAGKKTAEKKEKKQEIKKETKQEKKA